MSSTPSAPRLRRRIPAALLLALGVSLGGCSSDSANDWLALYKIAKQSWTAGDGSIQLNEAAAIPYATLGVRIGDEPEHLVVLATDSGGERLWTSAARVALTTRGGRIVSTAGLAQNLGALSMGTVFEADWRTAQHVTLTVDFPDLGFYAVSIDCNDVPAGDDPISILGVTLSTFRVDETCESKQLDWKFTNTYWVSSTSNRVWRSVQHIHPKLDAIEIELLRPPESQD